MDIIQVILLVFLSRHIRFLAYRKGLKPFWWIVSMIIAWVICGMIGCVFAMNYLGIDILKIKGLNDYLAIPEKDLLIISLLSLFFAFGGYLLVRATLEKKPDYIDKDTDRVETTDLKPPSNQS